MNRTIWDLKKDDTFRLKKGVLCRAQTPTEDGKGLVAIYLEDELKGQPDFVFEEEMDPS